MNHLLWQHLRSLGFAKYVLAKLAFDTTAFALYLWMFDMMDQITLHRLIIAYDVHYPIAEIKGYRLDRFRLGVEVVDEKPQLPTDLCYPFTTGYTIP